MVVYQMQLYCNSCGASDLKWDPYGMFDIVWVQL